MSRRVQPHLSSSSCFPFFYELPLIFRLLLGILERDVLALIRLENRTDIRRFVNTNGCELVSLENNGGQIKSFTFKKGYELDEPFIAGFSFPRLQDNGIFEVSCHVFRMRVKLYDISSWLSQRHVRVL